MTSPVRITVPNARHAAVATADLAQKVCIRHLNFYYGRTQALKDVSLTLYVNKVTAIIGPSDPRDKRTQDYVHGRFG